MDDLLAAKSIGKHFHANVRHLPSQRLSGDWPQD
jgi:hypothetical protein